MLPVLGRICPAAASAAANTCPPDELLLDPEVLEGWPWSPEVDPDDGKLD